MPGSADTYGLVMAVFKDQFNISLTNWARPDLWWLRTTESMFLNMMRDDGFVAVNVPVYEIKIGDCLLATVESEVPNRIGIHVGKGKILHHVPGRMSEITPLNGVYRDKLCAILRHPGVDVKPSVATVELLDLVAPDTKQRIQHALEEKS